MLLCPQRSARSHLCFELGRATVVVDDDQLSLAIGKHGQNVRLAARMTGWDIDILTPNEYNQSIEKLTNCVKTVEGADDMVVDKLIALGIISVADLEDVGVEPLVKELNIKQRTGGKTDSRRAKNEAKRIAAEQKPNQAENLLKQQSEARLI